MKLGSLLLSLFLTGQVASDQQEPEYFEEDLFSLFTEADIWKSCELTPADAQCPPTVPIEMAACEAPLVVFGRVDKVDDSPSSPTYGAVQITVEYQSRFFSGNLKKKIPKYGAGLENTVNGTSFFEDSGFFSTWVTGFLPPETRFSDVEANCGTLKPNLFEDGFYFFLKPLPGNEDVEATVSDDAKLSVNLTLSTSVFRSGFASIDAWEFVKEGIFNDDIKLQGDCEPVYCCYNPDCPACDGVLEKYPGYSCPAWTIKEVNETSAGESIYSSNTLLANSMLLGLAAQLL